jgi:hypothetical protein
MEHASQDPVYVRGTRSGVLVHKLDAPRRAEFDRIDARVLTGLAKSSLFEVGRKAGPSTQAVKARPAPSIAGRGSGSEGWQAT